MPGKNGNQQLGKKPTPAPGKPATGQSATDKKHSAAAVTGNSPPINNKPSTKMSANAVDEKFAKNNGQKQGVGL